jgi:hypothetical protein
LTLGHYSSAPRPLEENVCGPAAVPISCKKPRGVVARDLVRFAALQALLVGLFTAYDVAA